MTDTTIELFTPTGALRKDFSEAEIDSLSPERRQRFDALRDAALAEEEAESEVETASRALREAMQAAGKMRQAKSKAFPAPTFQQLWMRDVRGK